MEIHALVASLLMFKAACAADRMKICIAVEPSPFTYVCGYANRFQALTDYLPKDDHVEVVTTEVVVKNRPNTWKSIPLHYTFGVRCPFYPLMSISFDWTFKLFRTLFRMRPDILHSSSPGFFVLSAVFWGRVLQIPPIFPST